MMTKPKANNPFPWILFLVLVVSVVVFWVLPNQHPPTEIYLNYHPATKNQAKNAP
jgi:hypothetical protein